MIDYRKEFVSMATVVINAEVNLFTTVEEREVSEYLKAWESLKDTTEGFTREVEDYLMYCIREETDIGFTQFLTM